MWKPWLATIAPIATRAAHAGTSSDTKASDSAKASANMIGAAQIALRWTIAVMA